MRRVEFLRGLTAETWQSGTSVGLLGKCCVSRDRCHSGSVSRRMLRDVVSIKSIPPLDTSMQHPTKKQVT